MSITIIGGTFLVKSSEQRKKSEVWMQPGARDAGDRPRCKLLPKQGFLPSNADAADPFVTVLPLPLPLPLPLRLLLRLRLVLPLPLTPTLTLTLPSPGAALRRAARRCRTHDG